MAAKCLILTGCAGFIGINFVKLLKNQYDYVISIDKMGYATKYNADKYTQWCKSSDNIFRVDCDINDSESLKQLADPEFFNDFIDLDILSFASESHVDNSIKDPFSLYKQNASIPANILEWIGKHNWKKIRIYYHVSTDEVLGELPLSAVENYDKWFSLTSPLGPNNPYAASKAAQDCFLMSMRHTFQIPVKFIRMANQFGAHQHKEKMLPASILRALRGETIKIYGNGKNYRQWTPVSVTAKIISDILIGQIRFDDTIHIANRFGLFNNNVIVDKLVKCLQSKDVRTYIEYIEDRKGHDLCYALQTHEAIDDYFRAVNFDECINEAVDFYIDNKELYSK